MNHCRKFKSRARIIHARIEDLIVQIFENLFRFVLLRVNFACDVFVFVRREKLHPEHFFGSKYDVEIEQLRRADGVIRREICDIASVDAFYA